MRIPYRPMLRLLLMCCAAWACGQSSVLTAPTVANTALPADGQSTATQRDIPPMHETHAQAFARRAADDPHRPLLHFAPPVFWMNDPNGLIQFDGVYHIFFQYCHGTEKPFTGREHWGHARSTDLFHWTNLPVAITPEADYHHICSGSMVNHDGVPTAIYTGASPQQQCIATSGPDLLTWVKYAGNPIIAAPPAGMITTGFRDPTAWKENGAWIMGVGSGIKDQGGTVLLYRSTDFRKWDYLKPLYIGDVTQSGAMWECPNFFPLGDRHVLIVSAWTPPTYAAEYHPAPPAALHPPFYTSLCFVGSYRDHTFIPESQSELELWSVRHGPGGNFYAPQVFADEKQRRILFGLALLARDEAAVLEAGWEGVLTLPRELTLGADKRLRIKPVDEIRALRRKLTHFEQLQVTSTSTHLLGDLQGDPLEIETEIMPGRSGRVGLILRRSPDGQEQTRIFYDSDRQELGYDRDHSSLSPHATPGSQASPFALAPGEPLRLRIVTDRSIVEVYANERAVGTFRIYPSRADSQGVDLYATGDAARVRTLNAWELQ